jgi:hypothetical protein
MFTNYLLIFLSGNLYVLLKRGKGILLKMKDFVFDLRVSGFVDLIRATLRIKEQIPL